MLPKVKKVTIWVLVFYLSATVFGQDTKYITKSNIPYYSEAAMADITIKLNGTDTTISSDPDTPLLYALTDELQLKGPRFGCGLAQCDRHDVPRGSRGAQGRIRRSDLPCGR